MTRLFLTVLVLTMWAAAACGDDGHGDHCTSTEEAVCDGKQIRKCDGEHYGELEDCPVDQECMTMPDTGVTHCMLSSMMGEEAVRAAWTWGTARGA